MPMKRRVRKKGWEKSILINQASTGACQTHAFSFLWEQAQWSIKEDITRETAGSQHPKSGHIQVSSWFMDPRASSCQGWLPRHREQTNSKDRSAALHLLSEAPATVIRAGFDTGTERFMALSLAKIFRSGQSSTYFMQLIIGPEKPNRPVYSDTWPKWNGKNLKSAFLNFLFKFLTCRTKDMHFL